MTQIESQTPRKCKSDKEVPTWLGADKVMIRFDVWDLFGNKPPKKIAERVSKWANHSEMNRIAFGNERKTVLATRAEAREVFKYVKAEFTAINTKTQTSDTPVLSYWASKNAT